jgi:hypothetical protein
MPEKKKSLHYEHLKNKWTKRHKKHQENLFSKHKSAFEWFLYNSKQLGVGTLAGIFLLTAPIVPVIPTSFSSPSSSVNSPIDKKVFLTFDLKNVLPLDVQPLTPEQEKNVSEILTRDFGVKVAPELNGIRLNTTYGIIGQEQHLARYPGDNMYTHFENPDEGQKYWDFGMAPGLGGWGYFADSSALMTKEESDKEKYYIAVQTFLAPGFDQNRQEYLDFFKFRKMIVVNPQNGKAVVADIGDVGPAPWTGKQLGGSPELMNYLERYDGAERGSVLYFFIDDPSNSVPLGPISL